MATQRAVEYSEAGPEVRAVYDDIRATRKTEWINNFWKVLANDPATLKRTWESIKQIMAPGALDPLTKELLYIAVSVTNQCPYCIASHTASPPATRSKSTSNSKRRKCWYLHGVVTRKSALQKPGRTLRVKPFKNVIVALCNRSSLLPGNVPVLY